MSTELYFDYPSTAKIRIKASNCFKNPDYPYVYRIKTLRLDFLVPRAATIVGEHYVYIPNQLYIEALNKLYKSITYARDNTGVYRE